MQTTVGVGDYLIEQIMASGVRHVFGVPGDYVLSFFKKLSESPLQVVNTCDEQGAGFAADAYARVNGLGVVCVTYGVGGLKVANTTAEAYAEKVPVLVISGAPGTTEKQRNPMLHHKSNQYDTQKKVFEQICTATADLSDPATALQEIDRVLAAIKRTKRPGYIELPRDMVAARVERIPRPAFAEAQSDTGALNEALLEAAAKINAAHQPVILVGEELYRFGLSELAIQLAEKANIPMVVSILGKSAVPETHPLYMGVYAGGLGDDHIRAYVESSDCLILLGVLLTDVNLGVYSAQLDQSKSILVSSERITIEHHYYDQVTAGDFLQGLLKCEINGCSYTWKKNQPDPASISPAVPGRKISVQRLFQQINAFLDCDMVVISDVGDALFGAMDLVTCRAAQFLSPAYYTSLGFAVPASIGVQISNHNLRPLVLVGDGAFQMTGMELSTAVRYHLNPIVLVLNNSGYATERPMLDGTFNDVLAWNYSRLPDLLGQGAGFVVESEDQLEAALAAARQNTESFSIIDVKLAADDISPALRRLTGGLGKRA
jgi:TPP-dependent 2-oxoacid decarboxylase